MKDLVTSINAKSDISDYSDKIDFSAIFDKALEIFSEQGLQNVASGKESLASIELAKAKANSLLDSISNIIHLSHDIDIMSAASDRFKRKDELKILNSLRRACEMQTHRTVKNMEMLGEYIQKTFDEIDKQNQEREYSGEGENASVTSSNSLLDLMERLQEAMDKNIDSTQKIIHSTSKLIELERKSGGRPFGHRSSSQNNINYVHGLDGDIVDRSQGGIGKGKPRKLKMVDIATLEMNKNKNVENSI